jgi:hypothetical protein
MLLLNDLGTVGTYQLRRAMTPTTGLTMRRRRNRTTAKSIIMALGMLLVLSVAALAAEPQFTGHVTHEEHILSGITWDIWCVSNTHDWADVLVAHESGWTLQDSQEISANTFHCMAFMSSSESYNNLEFSANFQTTGWSTDLNMFINGQGDFRLDSWTPQGINPLGLHYVAYAHH